MPMKMFAKTLLGDRGQDRVRSHPSQTDLLLVYATP
jgi:hypothetical protein